MALRAATNRGVRLTSATKPASNRHGLVWMGEMMRRVILAAFAATAVGGALTGDVLAQPAPVNRVVAVVRPARYEGPCPARFEFIGTIYTSYPTGVTYRWERSDRAAGQVQTMRIRGAQNVVTSWQIGGGPGRVFSGSETLHVLSPVDMYSNPANFSMYCR
jgi:hypothetical protein